MRPVTRDTPVRFDLRPWPYRSEVLQLVLLDLASSPNATEIDGWIAAARARGAVALRTSALFPQTATVFRDAGFVEIDRLALLEIDLTQRPRPDAPERRSTPTRLTRLTARELSTAAEIDRRSFPEPWALDERAVADIARATPTHRARVARTGRGGRVGIGRGSVVGYAVSGRAGSTGYLQRLAVEPNARRQGVARQLVEDGLDWMHRHARHAFVNTGTDNRPALDLYLSLGFDRCSDDLVITEHRLG